MLKKFFAVALISMSPFVSAVEYLSPEVAVPTSGAKLVVNIPQARVYLYQDGQEVSSWRAGPGSQKTPTPTGKWTIGEIKDNPTWFVPASIQAEYRNKGMKVKASVPPGPHNPLGPVFIRMGQTSIGVHGTNRPESVPGFPSHGCIRMKSDEAVALSEGLRVGDEAEIVYQPVLFGLNSEGKVLMEVHPNIYGKDVSYELNSTVTRLSKWLADFPGDFEVDEDLIRQALRAKTGVPSVVGNKVGAV